jgi:hypothetical protein
MSFTLSILNDILSLLPVSSTAKMVLIAKTAPGVPSCHLKRLRSCDLNPVVSCLQMSPAE